LSTCIFLMGAHTKLMDKKVEMRCEWTHTCRNFWGGIVFWGALQFLSTIFHRTWGVALGARATGPSGGFLAGVDHSFSSPAPFFFSFPFLLIPSLATPSSAYILFPPQKPSQLSYQMFMLKNPPRLTSWHRLSMFVCTSQ
jgi:hypothetical protein